MIMTLRVPSLVRFFDAFRQEKPWGHELVFADGSAGYVGKVITVRAGHALSLQYHDAKDETICVLSGHGVMWAGNAIDDLEPHDMHAGDTVHVAPGALHKMVAVTDVVFVEASTAGPGWRDDVVRLEDRYGRQGTSAP
jgi:mannose-6-phosphate isomerase-like protein (cupin superfamily)